MSGKISRILRALALLALVYVVVSIIVASRKVLHGNHESLVFHEPDCRFHGSKNCTVIFRSRKAALDAGYEPASCCHRMQKRDRS